MQSGEDRLALFGTERTLIAAGKRKVVRLFEHAPLLREPGSLRTEGRVGDEPAFAKRVLPPEDGPLDEDRGPHGGAKWFGNERCPHLVELVLDDVARGMLASLALMRSPCGKPGAERLVLALQCLNGLLPRRHRFLLIRVDGCIVGSVGNLVDVAALEVTALRKMIDGAADFMRRQRLALERAPPELIGIALHRPIPVGRVARWEQSGRAQLIGEQAPALSPATQLTAAKACLPPLLVQRNALWIAGFGEDPHAETVDCSRAEFGVMVDHGEPDRGRADVQAKYKWHAGHSLLQFSRRTIVLAL